MASLKKLFESAEGRYEELRDAAEAAIVRREWADSRRHSLEPYYAESNCYAAGRVVDLPINDTRGLHEHGFDSAGRLRVVRDYNELPKRVWLPGRGAERPANERYYVYRDGEVDALLFDCSKEKRVINVARYRFDGDHLVEVSTRYKNQRERLDVFEWDAGLLVRSRATQPDYERTLEYTHDAEGELELIEWVYPNGHRTEMFRRIRETPAAVLARVKPALASGVRAQLSQVDLGTPVAAIALWLDLESTAHLLPPGLALLTSEEQAAFVSERGAEAETYLWSPVEWEHYDTHELEDDALHRAAGDANQLIWQQALHDEARALVDDVCRELNQSDLSQLLDVTPECLIFPVDITSGDGVQGVRRVATPEQLAALQRKGLLSGI